MITERHNIACRLIIKAIEAGSLGGCFAQMDIGSEDRFAFAANIHLAKPTDLRRIDGYLPTEPSQNGSSLANFLQSKDLLQVAEY